MKKLMFLNILSFTLFSCGNSSNKILKNNENETNDTIVVHNILRDIVTGLKNRDEKKVCSTALDSLSLRLRLPLQSIFQLPIKEDFDTSNIAYEFMLDNSSSAIGILNAGFFTYLYQIRGVKTYICYYNVLKSSKTGWKLSVVFNKENATWRLSSLRVGPYNYDGKFPDDYYYDAKLNYSNDSLIPALLAAETGIAIAKAGGPNYHMPIEDSLFFLLRNIVNKYTAKNLFPIKVKECKIDTWIDTIKTSIYNNEVFPMISFTMKSMNSDSAAIAENGRIVSTVINKYIPRMYSMKNGAYFKFYEKGSNGEHNLKYSSVTNN